MGNGTHSRAALAEELRGRLDRDLRAARKGRRQSEVNAIRGLKSALANAEAVPVAEGTYAVIEGSADVPRRFLGAADIARVVERRSTSDSELSPNTGAMDSTRPTSNWS
jgi:hypothetical protein